MPLQPLLGIARWSLELIALLSTGATFLAVARSWRALPARIPTSYGISGEPNRWGGRWLIWMYPSMTAALYVFLCAVTDTAPWPGAGGALTARALLAGCWVKALLCLALAYLCWATVRIARGAAERVNLYVFYAIVALILLPNLPAAFDARR
jgi:hypothetical protein